MGMQTHACDVVFDGPVQRARGKAEFVGLTGQFLQAHRETRLLGRMANGNQVASLFERDCPGWTRDGGVFWSDTWRAGKVATWTG